MKLNCQVSLCIFSSDLSADEIAARIGIPAEKQIQKGSPRGKSPILKHAEHVWILASKADQGAPVDKHVASLKSLVKGHEARISSLQPTCSIECSCVVRSSSEPALHFSGELIHWLSEIGATLDIDLYLT
jgi:hypothetical protein